MTGTALRVFAGLRVTASITTANSIILCGLALTVAATVASALRTRHPERVPSRGPRPEEAYVTTLATSTYAAILLIFLP